MPGQASSSHMRICHNSPRWAPITGLTPQLLQSTTSYRRKTCTRHRCSAGCDHALPRSIGRAQHTPPAPDPKIWLNRSPPAKVLVTNSLRWISTHVKTISHITLTTHASISTIQHGMSRRSRSTSIKGVNIGSSYQQQ